ncbi:MAG TPA: ATP-binding protein [Chthoniobacterales bacterium]|nr:ATP-binding protein [Chthoniobacterales bacterium]
MLFGTEPLEFPLGDRVKVPRRLEWPRVSADELIWRVLHNGENVLLHGHNGVGKTSLLNEIAFRARSERAGLVTLGRESLAQVAIGPKDKQWDDLLFALNAGSRYQLGFSGIFPASVRVDELFRVIETVANQQRLTFLLILDDCEKLPARAKEHLFQTLYRWQHQPPARVLLACAGDFLDEELQNKPILHGALGAFDELEMNALFAQAEERLRVRLDLGAREKIQSWTQGVPSFVQGLLERIERSAQPPNYTITQNDIESLQDEFLHNAHFMYHFAGSGKLLSLRGDLLDQTENVIGVFKESGTLPDDLIRSPALLKLRRMGLLKYSRDKLSWINPMVAHWFTRGSSWREYMNFGAGPRPHKTIARKKIPHRKKQRRRAGPPSHSAQQPREDRAQPVERYVNLWFVSDRFKENHFAKGQPLRIGQTVFLRVNIAPFDERTILEEAQPFPSEREIGHAFPETKNKPVPLEITIFSNDFETQPDDRTQRLNLVPGMPTETRDFSLKALKLGRAFLRLCIFYRNHLLQALRVSTDVVAGQENAREPQRAIIELTFSADFARVEDLPPRGLWLGLNQGTDETHTLNVKGDDVALSRDLGRKIENALDQARTVMLEISFDPKKDDNGEVRINAETGLPEKQYRFKSDHTPSSADARKRFKEDLTKLARVGSNFYQALLGTGAVPTAEERESAEKLVQHLKQALRDEQVIQISRLKNLGDIWPWALVYDLPLDPDRVQTACEAFRAEDGTALPYAEGVKRCTHRDPVTGRFNDDVVCPYGFWGFKHIVEQPTQPGGAKAFADLVREVRAGNAPILKMPLATELLSGESDHIDKMRALHFSTLESWKELKAALDPLLSPPEPHVMYFFCHGKYDSSKNPYLQIGKNDSLRPAALDDLDFKWLNTHGLVFINGCHTADLQPKDLSIIMAPFIKAYASGIIGTEITVHTFLARYFAQKFFERLLPNGSGGQCVGQIIRDLRLELLLKYNPLGLVYTAYCSADLHLTK